MKLSTAVFTCCAVLLTDGVFGAESDFFPIPARVIGQASTTLRSIAPNRVEGRELDLPQGVAVDTTVSPPIVYVADTLNNRVLAWKNANAADFNAPADVVIGQKDRFTSSTNGTGSLTTGLNAPTGLAVDSQGNLYILDNGNNRIMRYPRPFNQQDPVLKLPDAVIGQPNVTTVTANTGGISASTLSLVANNRLVPGSLLFDPSGNLLATDCGNNRVLRYAAADLARANSTQIAATVVLGQPDFISNTPTNIVDKLDQLTVPMGLAMDSAQRLYVSDALHRVLVFVPALPSPGFFSAQKALRVIGGLNASVVQGRVVQPPTNRSLFGPESVAVAGDNIIVADTGNNRVLRFPGPGNNFSNWPADGSAPTAVAVLGQVNFTTTTAATGSNNFSSPTHVFFSGTDLFVTDSANHRVVIFPQGNAPATRVIGQSRLDTDAVNYIEGRELYIGLLSSSPAHLAGGLAIDMRPGLTTHHLYIADTFNNRVLGYCDIRKVQTGDKADVFLGQADEFHSDANWNSDGTTHPSDANLNNPNGLAVDANGDLYVADTANGRVVRYRAPCDQPRGVLQHANLVLGQQDFTSHITDPTPRNLASAYGLAFTPGGQLLVSDAARNRVVRFDPAPGTGFQNFQAAGGVFGQPDFYSDTAGNALNQLSGPTGISTDTSGRLYVCDTQNNRILIWTDVATTVGNSTAAVLVTNSTSNSSLRSPLGIFVTSFTGEVWVSEAGFTGAGGTARILQYPEFLTLGTSPFAVNQFTLASPGTAIALDGAGELVVAEAGNRVSLYFPRLVPTSAANYLQDRALAPGMIGVVWPSAKIGSFGNFNTQSFDSLPNPVPLPKTLSDIQVLLNGSPVPLYFVSPGQINFQVPKGTPSSGTVTLQVTLASTGQILAAGQALMAPAAPGFLVKSNQAPFNDGQISSQNTDEVIAGKPVTCNGPDNPAIPIYCPGGVRPVKRGEIITLYLTGQGAIPNMPADGDQATGQINTDVKPRVLIGTRFVADSDISYSGLAPTLIGVWQINVKVPAWATDGENAVAVVMRDIQSMINGVPKTFITVRGAE